eukprot:1209855-Prymnesium_polylepis.1
MSQNPPPTRPHPPTKRREPPTSHKTSHPLAHSSHPPSLAPTTPSPAPTGANAGAHRHVGVCLRSSVCRKWLEPGVLETGGLETK